MKTKQYAIPEESIYVISKYAQDSKSDFIGYGSSMQYRISMNLLWKKE